MYPTQIKLIREGGSHSLFRDDTGFLGFGRFQVSETAIKQTQNLKLMREMQSTGQTDPTESIRCLQMCPRAQGRISEKPHIFLSSSSSFFIHAPSGHNVALKSTIHIPNNSLFPGIETFDTLFLFSGSGLRRRDNMNYNEEFGSAI